MAAGTLETMIKIGMSIGVAAAVGGIGVGVLEIAKFGERRKKRKEQYRFNKAVKAGKSPYQDGRKGQLVFNFYKYQYK